MQSRKDEPPVAQDTQSEGVPSPSGRHHDHKAPLPSSIPRMQAILCGALITVVLFFATYDRSVRLSQQGPGELAPAVRAYIDREVSKSMRDFVGRPDFALQANGAYVIPDLTRVYSADGKARPPPSQSFPDKAFNDDPRVGNCWLFPGTSGQIGFQLAKMIHPTHVSIDHIPVEIALDVGRAPRNMFIWGAIDGAFNQAIYRNITETVSISSTFVSQPKIAHGHTFMRLASFEYDIRAPTHVQTFSMEQYIVESDMYFGVMVLEIAGNWGGDHTCLYRVRVHGDPCRVNC